MISNCKVGAIVFFVSDLARSVAFYRDTLGLPVEALEGHDGPWAMGEVEGNRRGRHAGAESGNGASHRSDFHRCDANHSHGYR